MRLIYGQFDKEDPTRSIVVFDTKLNLNFVLFFFLSIDHGRKFQLAVSNTTGHALMINFNNAKTFEKSSACILAVFSKNDTETIEGYSGSELKDLTDEIAKIFNPSNFPL